MTVSAEPFSVWLPAVRALSGADVFTERLARALRARGHTVTVTWIPRWQEVAPFAMRLKPPTGAQIIHANTWNAFAFSGHGIPVVATCHLCVHDPMLMPYKSTAQKAYHRLLIREFERRSIHRASAVTAVSAYTAQRLRAIYSAAVPKVVYNWIDFDVFPSSEIPFFEPGVRPFKLLYVGSRSSRKGWDLLPGLMERLGEGYELHYAASLRGGADGAKLPSNMISVPKVEDDRRMAAIYQHADAVVVPSRLEGFGYSVAEAMACGRPVVAFGNSSITEVLGPDNACGIVVPTDDLDAMEVACRRLAADRSTRTYMGRNAANRCRTRFSEGAAVKAYEQIYQECLEA